MPLMSDTTAPPSPQGPWFERYAVRVKAGEETRRITVLVDVARKAEQQRIWESNRRRETLA